jgi:hypothetical protein
MDPLKYSNIMKFKAAELDIDEDEAEVQDNIP